MSRGAKQTKEKTVTRKRAPGAGRPKLEIDFTVFESLCRIQCTLIEIAAALNVSDTTLQRRCQEHYGANFEDIYKKLSAGGKMSLRRAQWKVATGGNVPMLIWLGKQYLAQTDKQEVAGAGGGPQRVQVEVQYVDAEKADNPTSQAP